MSKLLIVLSLIGCGLAVENKTTSAGGCFPFGSATLPKDFSKPSVSRSEWWCSQSQMYGFMGFSYPLEVSDCNDWSNSYDAINADFAAMKNDFGAHLVRVYAPECRSESVWENLLRAGVNNNMGVIPQVWWGFGDQSLWEQTQSSIYKIMRSSKYGAIAPYVFHSAEFGSEPIGDYVDNGPDQFVKDLAAFRSVMNGYGVPVAVSEDWDRKDSDSNGNVAMRSEDGKSLADAGWKIRENSDQAHAHIMPFYHQDRGVNNEGDAWDYIQGQVRWMQEVVQMPTFISETQWAWGKGGDHGDGPGGDVGTAQYSDYWHTFADNCELFKEHQTGWFWHAFSGESTLSERKGDWSYAIAPFKPYRC